jgi:2-methylcitrate dehydratase PrpD
MPSRSGPGELTSQEVTVTLSRIFSDFLLDTKVDQIPPADLQSAAKSFFDSIGVGLAGSASAQGRIVEEYVRAQAGEAEASVLGGAGRVPATLAALANGTFVHADDFDDMGAYGHQSAALVPALLAAAELAAPVSGSDLLAAYALGFEVATALHDDGRYDQYLSSFHKTSLFGVVAAAGAVARLLGLSTPETMATLALAATQAGGLENVVGTMVKPLHGGLAASSALEAARLAAAGVEGAEDVFEARGGFNEAFFQHRAVRPERIARSLGRPFTAASHVAIKGFPCCGSNQSALHALRELMARESISADDIEGVDVGMFPETSPVLTFWYPERGLNGKFSIRYVVGTMITKGAVRLDDFTDAEVKTARAREATGRVRAEVMSRWDRRLHDRKKMGNPVTVRTVDGRVLRHAVERSEMPGSAARPYTWLELRAKFSDNAARVLAGREDVAAAAALWQNLAEVPDVQECIDAVCPGSATESSR